MINIFYNINYIKTPKVFITKSFKYSVFYNLYLDILYKFNLPIQNNLIKSGPHKRINNLIKTFRPDSDYVFNRVKYENSYIVQFDDFGEKILKRILQQSGNNKILIGPLYNSEYDSKLIKYIDKYPNIKKVVASKPAYINAMFEMGVDIDKNKIATFPSGVISDKNLQKNIKLKKNYEKCLIYFKKRPDHELDKIINFVESKNIEYKVFKYGEYKNRELKKYALEAKFGIFMSRPETQGFAAQELLSCNLPLLVWDQKVTIYEDLELSGTTVSYWNESCGMIVDNYEELTNCFQHFYNNIPEYSPFELIRDELTYEKFKAKLEYEFNNFILQK